MGKLRNILDNAESRLVAHPDIDTDGSNVQHMDAPTEPSESEAATVFQIMTEGETHEGAGFFRGRFRVVVWHRRHQDERGDHEQKLGASGTEPGLNVLLETLVKTLHGSFLGDALAEPLYVLSHGQRVAGQNPGDYIRGDVVFRMGYISEAQFQATGDDGTGIDKGAA